MLPILIIDSVLLVLVLVRLLMMEKPGSSGPKTIGLRKREVIIDSCGLIDGRIVDLARAGFVPDRLIIPSTVIDELQLLADHGDSHKRERARYGLDVAKQLQEISGATILKDGGSLQAGPVDAQLVALAKKRGAQLYTTDFNLNKVASLDNVTVLNINELAQYLRPPILPGETAKLKIVEKGQEKGQGVGYLDDGTMVVVEKAANKTGRQVSVQFSRMLQTQAGRMMFAYLQPNDQQKN
ncbi:MAG TPA: hypothetical protein VGS28_02720 [Candidatus Saccharimonadales bacterium]|nr:hypothetical protein [Candidatus Saccharimonadales bacterium]